MNWPHEEGALAGEWPGIDVGFGSRNVTSAVVHDQDSQNHAACAAAVSSFAFASSQGA
jgi:hypothetical protein